MDYFPSSALDELQRLNYNLRGLNVSIAKASKSSDKLQEKLIFWTKIMAGAIISQIIALVMITFLEI
ncbi:hypothetical protein HOD75_02000 [archaeon]|jgi:hypothetical protein|nr:hypothetical protein [archaeon]MBT4241649.1 hypothetical protein [archaeon]MBT4418044.1 hypothetical protein [archaeon]